MIINLAEGETKLRHLSRQLPCCDNSSTCPGHHGAKQLGPTLPYSYLNTKFLLQCNASDTQDSKTLLTCLFLSH